jgi:signal transduction histidine kinase
MQRLFDPGFTTKAVVGTGLGLPLCLKIIENHKGRIEVESEPGQGATFRIILPAMQGARGKSNG